MAEFTKEQLIVAAKVKARNLSENIALIDGVESIHLEQTVELIEIALAALTASPFGFTEGDEHGMCYEPRHADRLNYPSAVYRLPLLEGLK